MLLVERSRVGLNALLGPKVALRDFEALQPKEGKLVKVATLKDDLVVANMEESASAQAIGVTPFKDGPLSILKEVLNQAGHRCPAELDLEHLPNGRAAVQRLHHHLVVDCIVRIERRKPVNVGFIKAANPLLDELSG